jgi:hypothetical protein
LIRALARRQVDRAADVERSRQNLDQCRTRRAIAAAARTRTFNTRSIGQVHDAIIASRPPWASPAPGQEKPVVTRARLTGRFGTT